MTLHFGQVDAGSTLYIPFTTFNAAGASVTLTGLAVTDIEIYKNGSVTQRASDNGYTLLDTDGIDFDGITGLHGFSIDLSDNSDAGFYAAGSQYWVVVSTVTVDSQTVTFLAATFRIGPQSANVTQFGGTAGTFSGGRPEVNTTHVAGTSQTAGDIIGDTNDIQSRLPAALVSGRIDASVGAMAANVMTAAAAAADFSGEIADAVWDEARSGHVTAGSFGEGVASVQGNVTGSVASVTGNVDGNVTGSVGSVASGGITSGSFGVGAITATAIAANAIGASELAADAVTEIQSGLATASALSTAQTDITAIKTQTDKLTFTVANQVDANIQYVNDVLVTGTGAAGDEWGP